MIDNLIAGLIAFLLIALFLGFYAVKLASIPLWIIIVGTLAMIFVNFYESFYESSSQNSNSQNESQDQDED